MMPHDISVRNKVIAAIKKGNEDRFRVFDNTGADKEVISGQFPDVIFKQKEPPPNNNILFVMKIETSGELLNSVSIWKDLGNASSVLYIVVPQDRLDDAKKLASVTGIRARFAWYVIEREEVKQLHYE